MHRTQNESCPIIHEDLNTFEVFCRGIPDRKLMIFGLLRNFPLFVDFSRVVLFTSHFFPLTFYLNTKSY